MSEGTGESFTLGDRITRAGLSADAILERFLDWLSESGTVPYPAQEEAFLELMAGRSTSYLPGWVERQVAFWTPMTEQAEKYGIVLLLENMWEPDPAIINSILDRVPSPCLKACLDVGACGFVFAAAAERVDRSSGQSSGVHAPTQ